MSYRPDDSATKVSSGELALISGAEQQRNDKHDHGADRRDQHRDEAERLTGSKRRSSTGPVNPAQIVWW